MHFSSRGLKVLAACWHMTNIAIFTNCEFSCCAIVYDTRTPAIFGSLIMAELYSKGVITHGSHNKMTMIVSIFKKGKWQSKPPYKYHCYMDLCESGHCCLHLTMFYLSLLQTKPPLSVAWHFDFCMLLFLL